TASSTPQYSSLSRCLRRTRSCEGFVTAGGLPGTNSTAPSICRREHRRYRSWQPASYRLRPLTRHHRRIIVTSSTGGRGGMADAADSKSVVRKDVGVQVSPPAPQSDRRPVEKEPVPGV